MPDAAYPITGFSCGLDNAMPSRAAIAAACRMAEPEALAALLPAASLSAPQALAAREQALALATALRAARPGGTRDGLVQGLLQEYSLSSHEGVALMCLAEALLRIPDTPTRDALIRDRIGAGRWHDHLGHSPSLFVNAATWGLLLTGRLIGNDDLLGLAGTLGRLLARGSEPLVRAAVDTAVRLMGQQFVCGESIADALRRAQGPEHQGFRHSFDMLGEAALTAADAARHRASYQTAIEAIGRAAGGSGAYAGPGISIKLSALHPRYCRAQRERVLAELLPTVLALARQARDHEIGFTIDAEESERLELSLDLLEALCAAPDLAGWNGLGCVVQAYQKRCTAVIDHLMALATRDRRRLMVRLVKGAYWDSEIKRAQLDGLEFPVFTRKAHTDVAYLACARRLLAAPQQFYPQFATHNALTVASLVQLAEPARWQPGQYEFQCLHGMGEALYRQTWRHPGLERPCRIYAPVGVHGSLLAYLVRRLLENGANSSFVHRIADPAVPLAEVLADPLATVAAQAACDGTPGLPNAHIPSARQLFGAQRPNSCGRDLAADADLRAIAAGVQESACYDWHAAPMLARDHSGERARAPVRNPADRRDIVGTVSAAGPADIGQALAAASTAAAEWARTPVRERAECLARAALVVEASATQLEALLMREAGKTAAGAVAEVREAVDMLHYYGRQAATQLADGTHTALGVVACISPWNFPLAIFGGQIAAALAAGNVVIAKPAEQTPLVAALATRLLWQAGVPRTAVQLLPGSGEDVGAALVADPRVDGVVFTGAIATARAIRKALAGRPGRHRAPPTLIAETGGVNAMFVDSTAMPEQAVADILASAFDSAGQRCSALRVLCVQHDTAEHLLQMLRGAMAQWRTGPPWRLRNDVGPLIDPEALARVQAHLDAMMALGARVECLGDLDPDATHGLFQRPALVELALHQALPGEVFGPVLHVVRYRREQRAQLEERIKAMGHGLTQGLHTRIGHDVERVAGEARVGNLYVNRNMIGAVVGVQPFGGEGLSGTGPKAGGPLYLHRLLARRVPGLPVAACAGLTPRFMHDPPAPRPLLAVLARWADHTGQVRLAAQCRQFARCVQFPARGWRLAGPTGQDDLYQWHARDVVLCLASEDSDLLAQLAAVLAVGAEVLWNWQAAPLRHTLPAELQAVVLLTDDWQQASFDLVLHHGDAAELGQINARLAAREGAIVAVHGLESGDDDIPLDMLLVERAISINTAASGGNASLMALPE